MPKKSTKKPKEKETEIEMKKKDFMKEHNKLIKLLNMGQKLIKEAKEQKKEMKKYKK